jgi:apolipoprotein N-acyltransferase
VSRLLTRLAPFVSGALWVLCYPKRDLGWLAWLGLAPLCWSLNRTKTLRGATAAGYAAGFVFYAGLLQWIDTTCRTAGLSASLSAAAWLALAAVLALHWALFGLGIGVLRRLYGELPAAAWAAWWVGIEWLSVRWTTRFPWGLAGYTQWRTALLLPTASVFGVYGLSFFVVAVNAAAARAVTGLRAALSEVVWTGTLAAVFVGLGAVLGPRVDAPVADTLVSIVQGNVDQYRKWDAKFEQEILTNYADLVQTVNSSSALIVWPESALPGWYDDARYSSWLSAVAKKSQTYHLVGVVTRLAGQPRNAAVLISPEGDTVGYYYKRQLVPFGETVPFEKWLGKYIPVLNELGHITPGVEDQPPLRNFWGTFTVGICYEAIFPHLFRQRATEDARLLVNLTNDGWYLDTAGPYQHFEMAVLRAAENRAYLIRAANTGISALVDPFGRVVARTRIGERTVLAAKFSMTQARQGPTFYAMFGDIFPALCLAGAIASMALGVIEKRAASKPAAARRIA